MSLSGNNVHWITARILMHHAFNTDYKYVFFEPSGKILKCYGWVGEVIDVIEPTEKAIEAVDEARDKTVIGLNLSLKEEEPSKYSPYVIIDWANYGLSQLMKAHFSEHTISPTELIIKLVKEFPVRDSDIKFFNTLLELSNKIKTPA